MASNVPLTIQTGLALNYGSQIVFGSNNLSIQYNLQNTYWMVIVDRTNLNVVANFTFTDNSSIPAQLKPYAGNSQYFLILNTQNLQSANLPQGDFYNFLISEGAGPQLNAAEQIYEALNCGTWGWMSYCYVAVLGDDANDGCEFFNYYQQAMVNTLTLTPITVGSQVYYTPVC